MKKEQAKLVEAQVERYPQYPGDHRKVYKHKQTGSKVNILCHAVCAGTGADCVVVENSRTGSDLLVMTEVFFNSWYEAVPVQKPMHSLDNDGPNYEVDNQ